MASDRFNALGDELDEAIESGRSSRFCRRFVVFVLLLALVGGGAAFLKCRYFAPIDVANATPDKAVGWLVLRDLSEESTETWEELFDMYIGNISVPSSDDAEASVYALPDSIKKFSGVFLAGRDEKMATWEKAYERPAFLRIDYRVAPSTQERASKYVLSSDILPGPALVKRWNARREFLASGAKTAKLARAEKNVQLLVMQWFAAKRKLYDSAPDDKKKDVLDLIVRDLDNVQSFYNKLRASAKKPDLTCAQLIKELESTMDGWLDFAPLDELAKVLWFKDLVVGIVAAKTSGLGAAKGDGALAYPPLYPEKLASAPRENAETSDEFGADEPKSDAPRSGGKFADALRGYFFEKKD